MQVTQIDAVTRVAEHASLRSQTVGYAAGRDKKFAIKPSLKAPDNKQATPTTTAKVAEVITLSCSEPAVDAWDSDAARIVRVAASGPTMSWRDDPKPRQ